MARVPVLGASLPAPAQATTHGAQAGAGAGDLAVAMAQWRANKAILRTVRSFCASGDSAVTHTSPAGVAAVAEVVGLWAMATATSAPRAMRTTDSASDSFTCDGGEQRGAGSGET